MIIYLNGCKVARVCCEEHLDLALERLESEGILGGDWWCEVDKDALQVNVYTDERSLN